MAGEREEQALLGTVEALATLVEARDALAERHAQQVSALVKQLALKLGMSGEEAHMLAVAGHLHDIGKVAIPDAILQKRAPLSEEEWQVIRTHPVVGSQVIHHVLALRPIVPIIRAHHERWDGQGYPDQLAGTAIPLGAGTLAVADAYDAMTSARPYRQARSWAAALAELQRCARSQFDPQIVDALQALQGESENEQRPVALGAGAAG